MPRLAAEGYTCIAPYLRGYTRENTPRALTENKNATVQIADLAADTVALVNATGFDKALLIGHDWGAITAYAATALAPEKFSGLVTLSVPHLKTLLSNLWKNPRQFAQSWYILFFQLRFGIPEARLARDNFALVDELWQTWSPSLAGDATLRMHSESALAAVKEIFSESQLLHNALAYYRGLLTPPVTDFAAYKRSRELAFAPITLPTLTLAGARDGCIMPEMFEGMQAEVHNDFVLRILPLVGHFLPLESAERIAEEILRFHAEP